MKEEIISIEDFIKTKDKSGYYPIYRLKIKTGRYDKRSKIIGYGFSPTQRIIEPMMNVIFNDNILLKNILLNK